MVEAGVNKCKIVRLIDITRKRIRFMLVIGDKHEFLHGNSVMALRKNYIIKPVNEWFELRDDYYISIVSRKNS